jgi:hypothetical protein
MQYNAPDFEILDWEISKFPNPKFQNPIILNYIYEYTTWTKST